MLNSSISIEQINFGLANIANMPKSEAGWLATKWRGKAAFFFVMEGNVTLWLQFCP